MAYSRTQSNIALCSGEAEFYGLVSIASEALGFIAMSEDFGDKVDANLYADTSAQPLLLQQALRQRRLG